MEKKKHFLCSDYRVAGAYSEKFFHFFLASLLPRTPTHRSFYYMDAHRSPSVRTKEVSVYQLPHSKGLL